MLYGGQRHGGSHPFPARQWLDANTSPSRGRRYAKWVLAALGALGITGAIGSQLVGEIWPDVSEKVRGGGPVRISVREDPQGGGDGFSVAARSPAGLDSKLRGARDCDSLFEAAKNAGAVDIHQSIHALLLEGRTHRDAAIVDMRARVRKRERPLGGAHISCQSAGALDAIGIFFNLDEPRPVARELKPGLTAGRPYFASGNVISLTQKELQAFRIVAEVSADYVEWEIEADLVIDGEPETLTINRDGEPFRLTGARQIDDYARYFEWVWYEQPMHMWVSNRPNTPG
jgi:hypothetical protein